MGGRVIALQNQTVQDIVNVDQARVLAHIAATGAFKEETARLTKLLAEVNERLSTADTLDEAKKIKAEAQAYADERKAAIEKETAGLLASVREKVDQANQLASEIATRDARHQSNVQAAAAAQASVEADMARREKALSIAVDKLGKREGVLRDAQEKLDAERAACETDRKLINERLRALQL